MTTPAPVPVAERTAVRLPAALSFIAGVTDVTSWLLLGGLFTAHITGNLVVLAADAVTGTPPHLAAVLALPAFVVVTVVATWVARGLGGHHARTRCALLGAQAVLLLAAAVLSFAGQASAHPDGALAVSIGLCAVCAMAAQNAYLHLVPAKAYSTAVMTGNLVAATIAGADLLVARVAGRTGSAAGAGASAVAAHERWTGSWPLLAGFVGGCLVGAAASTLLGDHAAVVPAVFAAALFCATVVRRTPAVG